MYSNHLWLTSTTTTAGYRTPRNIRQELTITVLPGNQFTLPPRKTKQKTSIAKQVYPQLDTLPPTSPRDRNTQIFILFILFTL